MTEETVTLITDNIAAMAQKQKHRENGQSHIAECGGCTVPTVQIIEPPQTLTISNGGTKHTNQSSKPIKPTPTKRLLIHNSNKRTEKSDAVAIVNGNKMTLEEAACTSASDMEVDSHSTLAGSVHDAQRGSGTAQMVTAAEDSNGAPQAQTELQLDSTKQILLPPICLCTNPTNCVTLRYILDSFKSPLSEEQAWAVIFQCTTLYRTMAANRQRHIFNELEIPDAVENLSLHRDGTVHCSWSETERKEKERKMHAERKQRDEEEEQGGENHALLIASHKKILRKIAVIVFTALDYNLQADEQCQMSQELEELITHMTAEDNDDDCVDEGIDDGYKRWDDDNDDEKWNETKGFDFVLEACRNHVKPTVPEDHYKAVCRALVTETIELKVFLQQVLHDGADSLHLKADSQTSKQELAKLGFNDWARFWVQVIDELRRGVRLKKNNYTRTPIEYELTPYEILMEDIRSKKYQLRKVMVNGDIPPRVKKDAHALILEFIRSRPPLKKASERQLAPPIKRTPSPREQLMDSIRKGQTLKHIQPPSPPRLKDRLLPPATTTTTTAAPTASPIPSTATVSSLSSSSKVSPASSAALSLRESMEPHTTPRSKQRLIKVDFSLLQDDDHFFDEALAPTSHNSASTSAGIAGVCSQPKMPPYPIGGYMAASSSSATHGQTAAAPTALLPTALTTRVLRRTTYDLATQCESRRASRRRHTIVGCQSNFEEIHSMPPSRPDSRQSEVPPAMSGVDRVSTTKQLHNNYNQQQKQHQQQQQLKRTQAPNPADIGATSGSSASNNIGGGNSSAAIGPWNKSFLDEKTWLEHGDDRLSLTLDEIVHIRSVLTKAELEALPVGVNIKEDVERRKVCFLCLRTRFSIIGPWGTRCKLCQRTVCSKCYTKMRIPSEHFRNVPLVLISPSLLSSPAGSSTPSPSHHAHTHHTHSSSTGNILDEAFPKSLIERLLRSESDRKARNSAPASPKHQRSNMSTPGGCVETETLAPGQAIEALHDAASMTSSYTAAASNSSPSPYQRPQHQQLTKTIDSNQGSYPAPGSHAINDKHISIMSRSMEGPHSLPAHSPGRPHSNSSTLDRKSRFPRAFTLSSSGTQLSHDQKENMRGELVPVCKDCNGLVMEITRSSRQTRSSARNRALKNLTLDLSPVYK